ncbi:hypothetical protein K443DRAFT_94361 [Laccaria amethystina LaAM-08-1]|uniref:Uncharacterized protein n=1 Tax=Laccaria amethystina LaAM-08-1 TaxID=1095629 RepID=A0A0C9XQ74_9AGAR|nr:hypothetical protein K443DRAFT_94361 [Laccaria amethystina LaAM-08-1]
MGYKRPVLTGEDRFILTGPVFCGLGPVWLRSFSGHETRLPNTNSSSRICSHHASSIIHQHYH